MSKIIERRLMIDVSDGQMAAIVWETESLPAHNSPALVFVHANGFCGSTYRSLLQSVAAQAQAPVMAIDLRGHGRTNLPDEPMKQDNWYIFARDLVQVLRQVAPNGTCLAGHSMGGTSSLLALEQQPDLVKGLCLFDPVLAPTGFYLYAKMPWVFRLWRDHFPMARNAQKRRSVFASRGDAAQAYTGRGAFKSWPAQTIVDYCEDGFTDQADGSVSLSCSPSFEASCFAGQRHNPLKALKAVKVPARLFRASRGSTTVVTLTGLLQRAGFQVSTVENTSHFLPMERADLCATALVDLIKST